MKDFKIYLSTACALMLVYLIAQYNKPTPVNWSQTYYYNDKIPFGTYIVYHRLPDLFPGTHLIKTNGSIYRTFHDSISAPGNYLVVARSVNINKDDFTEMVKYIKAGNAVFISSLAFKGFLADTLKLTTDYEYKGGNAKLNFTNSQLKQPDDYVFENSISNRYFSGFDTAKATVISKNNFGNSNLLSFKFGKGSLFICATPGVFTNYSLLSKQGADYAAKAMSYLPVTRNVYWDEFQNGDVPEDESPMRVFFSHPSLQWAYYISLVGIIIFVLFEMKRRQRIIPVIEPLSNSTLDFVNVVGQVYYEKRDNANIAHKKILYLLEHLRDEYQVKTNKLDAEFIEKLETKLGLNAPFANELVNFMQYIAVQNYISDHDLINLNKLIEQFYIQSA
jgi:hypothetical protein